MPSTKKKTKKASPAKPPAQTAPGYAITVKGQYFCISPDGKGKVPKFYKNEVFRLPEISTYREGRKLVKKVIEGTSVKKSVPVVRRGNTRRVAQYLIQNYHLGPRLREKYEDFVRFRTCHIQSIVPIRIDVDEARDVTKTPIQDMTESELLQYYAINDLVTDIGSYESLSDKKEAVIAELEEKGVAAATAKTPTSEPEEQELNNEPWEDDPDTPQKDDEVLDEEEDPMDTLI